jgi:O-antigen/teichoic acid export membrane protein
LRPILFSLSIAVLELSYFTIINHYFTGIGLNKLNIFGSVIGNVTTVISGILLVPVLGSVGAGIATSISYLIMLIYLVYQFKKQSNTKFRELVPSIGSLKIFFTEQTT